VCDCLFAETAPVEGKIWKAVDWVAMHYTSGTPISLLKREHDIPALTDAVSWTIWKEDLLRYYNQAGVRDAAIFLQCYTDHF